MTKHIQYLLLTVVLLWSAMTPARASDCTIPNTFTSGTPAVAAEVNADFSAIEAAVDDNHSQIEALQASVDALQAQIETLQSENAQLQGDNTDLAAGVSAVENNSVLDLDGILTLTTDNSGYDTARFTGVNLRIVNGTGTTDGTPDGTGNLIVGYNEKQSGDNRSGSHNLVVGIHHAYSSYGGLVAGNNNTITGTCATVSGGTGNSASGDYSSVTGGTDNAASGPYCTISGGSTNEAWNDDASVVGGRNNNASGPYAVITGGLLNRAQSEFSCVSGGGLNTSDNWYSSVSGGTFNNAAANGSSVTGGSGNWAEHAHSEVSACENCATDGDFDFEAQGTP